MVPCVAMATSTGSPCAACKFLRRKCTAECVFAPYFPPEDPHKFANVHKVFGASNVSKILNDLPLQAREDAVNSLAYEADARVKDPVYGCVGAISILQSRIAQLQAELVAARSELCKFKGLMSVCAGPMAPSYQPHLQVYNPSHSTSPFTVSSTHSATGAAPPSTIFSNNGTSYAFTPARPTSLPPAASSVSHLSFAAPLPFSNQASETSHAMLPDCRTLHPAGVNHYSPSLDAMASIPSQSFLPLPQHQDCTSPSKSKAKVEPQS